jgi:thioredoxin 1
MCNSQQNATPMQQQTQHMRNKHPAIQPEVPAHTKQKVVGTVLVRDGLCSSNTPPQPRATKRGQAEGKEKTMGTVVELTDANFDQFINENERVLVDFWAEWCGPCKAMSPVLDQLAADQDIIKVAKLNTETYRELAVRFNIMSIPNMKVFINGEVVDNLVGMRQKAQLMDDLAPYLDPDATFSTSVEEFGLKEFAFNGIPTSKAYATDDRTLVMLEVEGDGGGRMILSADNKRMIVTYQRGDWTPLVEWVWLDNSGKMTNMEAQTRPGGTSIHFSKNTLAGDLVREHMERTKHLESIKLEDCRVSGAMYQVARASLLLVEHAFDQERRNLAQIFSAMQRGN